MKARLEKINNEFEKKPSRTRLLILCSGILIIFLLWLFIFYWPLNEDIHQLQLGIDTTTRQMNQMNSLIETTIAEVNSQTETLNARSQQLRLTHKSPKNYAKIKTIEQFDQLMQGVINAQGNLILTDIKKSTTNGVFTVEIKLQCTYFQAREYLQRLEDLPWCISWEMLDYKVSTYPQADMTIILHAVKE